MLTPGEFVMSKGAVQKYGSNMLASMNAAGGGTNRPTLGRYNKGGNVSGMSMGQQIMQQTDSGEDGSISTFQATPEQRKTSYAEMGMPSMELWDGSVVPNFGKMGAEKISQGLQMTRDNMVENGASPDRIAKLDELMAMPEAKPTFIQNSINRIVPGSTEQVLGDMGDSITQSARMNGGGLVQAFQGGGQVRQMGRGASNNRMKLAAQQKKMNTPGTSSGKKTTVAYQDQGGSMKSAGGARQPGNKELPSFSATAMRSPDKIRVLGISV